MSKAKTTYKFHIPEGPDVYSQCKWTVPDVDTFRNEVLAESMIYHVGHLVEDCEMTCEESDHLKQIRRITQEESDKGRIVLFQKKIRSGSYKPEKHKGPVVYGKSAMRRSKTKPIFEYYSHPVQNTG